MKMKKINIRYLNNTLESYYDVFICSASFEQRCLSIPQKIKNKSIKKALIMENMQGSPLVKNNAQTLNNLFGSKAVPLNVDFSEALTIADKIVKELNSLQGRKLKVLIDVTAFTHEILMICLKVLLISNKVESITGVYVNASAYCPDQTMETKWLSKGCQEIRSVLGYPGMLLPSQKTHLIVVVGYEYERAFDMISALEPNSISLVYGSPDNSITEKDKEANQVFNDLVRKMTFEYSNVESIKIPCNDPYKTAESLQALYDLHETDNIIVVPMNNKMSTVGVVLSTLNNERVQICYAPAVVYNESNYSSPGVDSYIFSIPK